MKEVALAGLALNISGGQAKAGARRFHRLALPPPGESHRLFQLLPGGTIVAMNIQ